MLISFRHVVSMALKLDDGTELILEFDETNRPYYKMMHNQTPEQRTADGKHIWKPAHEHIDHEIRWHENIPPAPPVYKEATAE